MISPTFYYYYLIMYLNFIIHSASVQFYFDLCQLFTVPLCYNLPKMLYVECARYIRHPPGTVPSTFSNALPGLASMKSI